MGRGGYPLDETVGAATSRPHPRIFDSTRLNGTVDNNVPFNGRLSSVMFGRILSAPTRQSWLKIYEFPMAVRFLASPEGKLDFLTIGTSEPIGKKADWGSDRLAPRCSSMSGKCSNFYHSTTKSETFGYRRPSSVSLWLTASPRGKPRAVTISFCHSTDGSIP